MTPKRNIGINSKWWIGLLATIISVLIIALGFFFFNYEVNKTRNEKNNEFEAISKLKIDPTVLIYTLKERLRF